MAGRTTMVKVQNLMYRTLVSISFIWANEPELYDNAQPCSDQLAEQPMANLGRFMAGNA